MKTAFGENAQCREFAEGLQVSVIVTAHDLAGGIQFQILFPFRPLLMSKTLP